MSRELREELIRGSFVRMRDLQKADWHPPYALSGFPKHAYMRCVLIASVGGLSRARACRMIAGCMCRAVLPRKILKILLISHQNHIFRNIDIGRVFRVALIPVWCYSFFKAAQRTIAAALKDSETSFGFGLERTHKALHLGAIVMRLASVVGSALSRVFTRRQKHVPINSAPLFGRP